MEEVIKLVSEFGSIGLAAFLAFIIWKLVGNHINHNTEALKDLTSTLKELKQFLLDNRK